jgi:hypothetical protein
MESQRVNAPFFRALIGMAHDPVGTTSSCTSRSNDQGSTTSRIRDAGAPCSHITATTITGDESSDSFDLHQPLELCSWPENIGRLHVC